jgi:preprotein translocase subunit SecY
MMLTRALRNSELRTKLAVTAGLLLVYRIGSTLPAPGVSVHNVHVCLGGTSGGGLLALVGLFSGGALLQLALFSLGVMPYITSSIIFQLLGSVVPRIEALKKDGPSGQAKITQWTRYTTVGLALIQAVSLTLLARGAPSRLFPACGLPVLTHQSLPVLISFVTAVVAGCCLVMWLGELITEHGIGQGMSLIMLVSIASRLPGEGQTIVADHGWWVLGGLLAGMVVLISGVVFIEQASRRIPVIYTRRQVSDLGAGAAGTFLPLKVNQAGVIPVIFTSSLLYVPILIARFKPNSSFALFVDTHLEQGAHPLYLGLFAVLTFFFAFFYVATTYDPADVAENIHTSGGFLPGLRPGSETVAFLDRVLTRLTIAGGSYLVVIGALPFVLLGLTGSGQSLPLGGTSLLILVGVALDTTRQLDGQLATRNTAGFLTPRLATGSTPPRRRRLTTTRSTV